MKTIRLLILLLVCMAHAPRLQAQGAATPIYNLRTGTNALASTNWIAIVTRPNSTNGTEKYQLSSIINLINIALTNTQGTNLITTNATEFGVFYQNNGNLLEFFGLKQGTNVVLYRDGSNIVVNGSAVSGSANISTNGDQFGAAVPLTIKSGSVQTNNDFYGTIDLFGDLFASGSGRFGSDDFSGEKVIVTGLGPNAWLEESAVTAVELGYLSGVTSGLQTQLDAKASTTQLNTASNNLVTLFTGYDTFTSNALYSLIIGGGITAGTATNIAQFFATNSAIVTSNALLTTLVANDTTTSNGLYSVETTRNAAVSNALASLLVANDTTTSNGLITLHAMAFTNANQVWSNVVVVNPTGNVLTNGILLTNAVKYAGTLASATRKVLVRMMPGHYHTPVNTLPSVMFGVENVSTYWEPGAVWSSGQHAGDVAYMFDDTAGVRTNCNVYGYGRFIITNDSVSVLYLEAASRVRFEAESMYVTTGTNLIDTAAPITWGGAACDIDLLIRDYIEAPNYDAIYGDVASGQKLRGYVKEIRAAGDLVEFNGDSPDWGNIDLSFDIGRQTVTNLQPTFLQIGGRTKVRGSQIFVTSVVASLGSAATATNGIVEGFVIQLPANSTAPAIQGNSTSIAGMHLRNLVIYGPTNVDMISISNTVTMPLVLENCTFYTGWASTNWIRGATPSFVSIIGGLGLVPYKPIGSQITVISTNYLSGIRNIGTLVQHGVSAFSNTVTVAADMTVGGTLNGDAGSFNSITAINQFNLPNGAGPFAPGEGDVMFDTDYWAAGRGAFVTWDGTANVVIPAVLQSDTPSNGQVLKFNTGGTFTWEDDNDSGGGSGGTNFQAVLAQLGNTNLTLQAGKRTTHYFATNGNHGIDADLAAPASGHTFINIETNSAATNYTVTFYTNGVAATFYDIAEKTNNTSFAVPVGAMVETEFTWTGSQWLFKREAPSLVFAVDTTYYSMATGGVNNLTTTLSPAYIPQASSMVVSNLIGTVGNNVTNENTPAMQINSGTLTLTPGVVSNLVASSIGIPAGAGNIVSNIQQLKFKATASPAITTSNLLINFNTNRYFLTGLTNAIFTNLVEESTSALDTPDTTVFIKNTTAVTMGLVWPAYGAQHGYFIRTNANNPVISTTSLAAGAIGVASITVMPDGTNMFLTFTTWP